MQQEELRSSADYKQLQRFVGNAGVDKNVSMKLGYASREDYITKSFDGRLVDVILPLLQSNAQHQTLLEAVEWCIKQKTAEDGGEGLFVTKNFYTKKPLYDVLNQFGGKEKSDSRHLFAFRKARRLLVKIMKDTMVKEMLLPKYIVKGMDLKTNLSTDDTSCGLLAHGTKEENKELIVDVALKLLHELPELGIPAYAITRAQVSNYINDKGEFAPTNAKLKMRLVWCVDAATVLVESMYARPFIDGVLSNQMWYAGGKDDGAICQIMERWKSMGYWISVDYSKFDSTVPSWLIAEAFNIVKEFFHKSEHKVIGWIADKFINTSIVMPDGNLYRVSHGIPSGSYFTQIIGSIVNALIMLSYQFTKAKGDESIVKRNCFQGNTLTMMFMGDDSVTFTRNKVDKADFSRYVRKVFGMECHPDKCEEGTMFTNPIFLKREWTPSGAYRPLLDLVINMMHPEREREYDTYSPYHILYGYYLTYPVAMSKIIPSKQWLIEGMKKHGGVEALLTIRPQDMPGSLRVKVLNGYHEWQTHIESLVAISKRTGCMRV